MVWNRISGLPEFRKLWGRIETTIHPGTYTLMVNNTYDQAIFGGTKSVVLSTTNKLGGKNYILGTAYLVVGTLCFVFLAVFMISYFKNLRIKRERLARLD
jgi:hypothetical protein